MSHSWCPSDVGSGDRLHGDHGGLPHQDEEQEPWPEFQGQGQRFDNGTYV